MTALPALAAGEKKPNVLFLAIDDMNDWLGCLGGHPDVRTPNIDRLARRGTVFANAHCQAPICGPSRASIMTGLLPSTTGIYGQINDAKIRQASAATETAPFLFEYFRDHGYKTMAIGKLFHQHVPKGTVDESGGRVPGFGPVPPQRFKWDAKKTSTDWGAFPDSDEQMPDYGTAQWSVERLKRKHEKPFLLAAGFLRPHVPWYVPKKWFDMYPADRLAMPPYLPSDYDDIPEIGIKLTDVPMMPTTEWAKKNGEWKYIVQAYLACVTFVDHYVGEILKALEESGYADNTYVVLWGDHGYHIGEKNRFAKHSLWEEATRAPLLVAGPGLEGGQVCKKPVGMIDMYPTLLDLCGLPANQ
jgi:arylsulfatase A-like enzyme